MTGEQKPKKSFMTDDDGNPSSMRMMSMAALVAAICLAFMEALDKGDVGSEIILYFLVAAFAPKAFQKFAEKK